jgi:hypothetical protein
MAARKAAAELNSFVRATFWTIQSKMAFVNDSHFVFMEAWQTGGQAGETTAAYLSNLRSVNQAKKTLF